MNLYCLANEVKVDYAKLIWDDLLVKLSKKQREKVVNYSRIISLMLDHKMKETYETFKETSIPTSIFSVNNLTLKPNQPEGPPFTPHMLAIYTADRPKEFQAPKSTLQTGESVTEGSKLGAKPSQRKSILVHQTYSSTILETPFIGPLSKEATKAQKGHSKKQKKSTQAKDKNLSQPSASTHVLTEMHTEAPASNQ
ncbi:hypothetical protein Tco_1154535 [Tanacetum coccineum]